MVYAKKDKRNGVDGVTLDSVIGDCKLAILLTCAGDDLLREYMEGSENRLHPDILMCPAKGGIGAETVEIYMVLLINILDSEIDVAGSAKYDDDHIPLLANVVYTKVRSAIEKIFRIVKLFKCDHIGFWSYLQHVGCVTDNADAKDRQEMQYPGVRLGPKSRFRVYGQVCSYDSKDISYALFTDFKNIQLVYHVEGTDPQMTMDYRSVSDLRWPAGQADKIDRFLKRYQESMTRRDHLTLNSLLTQFQNIDSVSSRAVCELGE
jgi:hypothetical protein